MALQCSSREDKHCEEEVDLVEDFQISASEESLKCSDAMKHKVVSIAEFLVDKYEVAAEPEKDTISNNFVEELNRGGLCAYT